MKTQWDYTDLAESYLRRPDYSVEAIDSMLAKRGFCVTAVEPNEAMMERGRGRTAKFPHVDWHEGTGECTGCPDRSAALVTFGSSFNVVDRPAALRETARILKPRGWFACLWNHRDLEDPLQKEIESHVASRISGYEYGSRREDQSEIIRASGFFEETCTAEGRVIQTLPAEDWIAAWRSHATLQRQAGESFASIVDEIATIVHSRAGDRIAAPYITRIWYARLQ